MLATIDNDIQNVNITKEESAQFTCNFSKGNQIIDVYWTVEGKRQRDCGSAEEDVEAGSNGCYTTETQSVLLIRNTSSFTLDKNQVQCILEQNISDEFRKDNSFKEEYDTLTTLTRTAFLFIEPPGELILSIYNFLFHTLSVM